jgi:Tfp pilus assembly PilM family ATPase/cell division protein FtsB
MNVTSLTINANTLKALALHGSVLKKQQAPLPPGSVKNGLIIQPETMGREIRSLFKDGKLSGGKVICSINGLPFTYRLFTLPDMETKAFHEAVLRTAKKEMSISPDEMYLSWQVYPGDPGEYQVLVTGITRQPVANLIKSLGVAGTGAWLLDLPHLALARLCAHRDAVIMDLEKDCSNIVMIVDGIPRGLHMVPTLAAGASLQDQIGQVTDKLVKMVEFYNGGRPVKPLTGPVKVLITGELLEDEKAFDYIGFPSGYNVEELTPYKYSLTAKAIRQVAVNAGMLDIRQENPRITALSHHLDLLEIIKENHPKANINGAVKKFAIPMAVAAGIGLLAFSYLSLTNVQTQVHQLQSDITRSNSELTQKKNLAAETKQLKAKIEDTSARIEEIQAGKQAIYSSREYVGDIASIVSCMPQGVTFNDLAIDSVEISLQGSAAVASSVVTFADNLETFGKFSQAIITWIDQPEGVAIGKINFRLVITRS